MANTFELIASSTVGAGGAASIDFTSIPNTYTDLNLVFSLRSSALASSENIYVTFNGSTSSFSARWMYGDGSTIGNSTSGRIIGFGTAANNTANTFGTTSLYIPNYAGSNNKSYSADTVTENNATLAYTGLIAGLWSNTAAISSISIVPQTAPLFVQYSTAYLYGVKNA